MEQLAKFKFKITVNVREYFTYELDFRNQYVLFMYVNRTDEFQYNQSFRFSQFVNCDWCYQDDIPIILILVDKSIDTYLRNNIISASVRRAWIKFKEEYCAALNSLMMLKFQI